jgi:hypothetical protein
MLKPYDVLVVFYKNLRGKLYSLVELSVDLAPLALHVPNHDEQLPHVPVQKFVVVLDHAFQVLHALPHRLHGLETFVNRYVELRDGVTASRTTHRMHPKRVDIVRVSAVIVAAIVVAVGFTATVRAFGSLLLGRLFPIVEVIVLPSGGRP